MKIGLDFDRVLFKTDEFNEYLKKETGLHHVDENVYDKYGCYSPKKHAKASGVEVEKIYDALNDLKKFLYDDVEKIKEIADYKLFIVTRGEEKFQRAKVKASGADELVEKVIVVQEKPKDVEGIDFLIDDREKELEMAGIEGYVLDRSKNSLQDAIKEVKDR